MDVKVIWSPRLKLLICYNCGAIVGHARITTPNKPVILGRYNGCNFASTANFVLYEVDRGNQHFRGYKHTEGNDFTLRNVKYTQERRGELNRKTRNVELLFAKRLLWWRKFPRWGYNRELSGWRRNFALVVVTMAYSGHTHGIEMKRYESRGNRLETSYVLLNNSALPYVDPVRSDIPHGSHPPLFREYRGKRQIDMENLYHGPTTRMRLRRLHVIIMQQTFIINVQNFAVSAIKQQKTRKEEGSRDADDNGAIVKSTQYITTLLLRIMPNFDHNSNNLTQYMITERRAVDFPRKRCSPRSCLVLVRSIVMQARSSGKDVADPGYSRFQDNADFDAPPINPLQQPASVRDALTSLVEIAAMGSNV
ncbi:hypothetical protein EAG_15931 [Camponotus floridanus]|uniref:Uncharacterized protein n=1 Tax=Camponotus floridanus TaxID=104421 RepID=E2AQD3_CAMFO|nr:hypothetical protein EAG_15931 [Camponotus floridanus]